LRRRCLPVVQAVKLAAAAAAQDDRIAYATMEGSLRVVPPQRLRFSLAHLQRDLVPFRAGLDALRRIEAEDVLGAELVLDVRVDSVQVLGAIDVIDVAARFCTE